MSEADLQRLAAILSDVSANRSIVENLVVFVTGLITGVAVALFTHWLGTFSSRRNALRASRTNLYHHLYQYKSAWQSVRESKPSDPAPFFGHINEIKRLIRVDLAADPRYARRLTNVFFAKKDWSTDEYFHQIDQIMHDLEQEALPIFDAMEAQYFRPERERKP